MEITHSKGLMYPALQLSSFRVRRDSLPPAFELPAEVARAVQEPLPQLRQTSYEEKALKENLRLLQEDKRERAAAKAAIAKAEATKKRELERIAEESKKAEFGGSDSVVRRVCDMGFPEANARRALAANNWDETAAINSLLSAS